MSSDVASLNLASVAYRVATDADFLPELEQQIEDGVYTAEETAALVILLDQRASRDAIGPGPQVGWIG